MIKIGMIGMNPGNGHPYSYSSMFNGFCESALLKYCEFELIKDYLPKHHSVTNQIENASVDLIWTQDKILSDKIAKVANIPNVSSSLDDLISKSDAIILARDDPWNRAEYLKKLIISGKPFFIDKLISSHYHELDSVLEHMAGKGLVMATSAARYLPKIEILKSSFSQDRLISVHGMSRVNWERYGSHLLDPISSIIGSEYRSVRSLSPDFGHDIVQIKMKSGQNLILECVENISLPIETKFFFENETPKMLLFDDFYFSFNAMMRDFVKMVTTSKLPVTVNEVANVNRMILAGMESKATGGKYIDAD
jgi:hypothetical protein